MANLLITIYSFLPSSDSNEFDFYLNKIYMFFMVFWVTDYKSVHKIAKVICLNHFFKQIILKNYRLSTRCICFCNVPVTYPLLIYNNEFSSFLISKEIVQISKLNQGRG